MSASTRRVKFVASDPDRGGLPVKRKQTQHACESCRRRKRRCTHVSDATSANGDLSDSQGLSPSPPNRKKASLGEEYVSQEEGCRDQLRSTAATPSSPSAEPAPTSSDTRHARFVGDMNPEGMFIEATGPLDGRDPSRKADTLGLWISPGPTGAPQSTHFMTARPPPIMDRFLLPFVKEHCLTCLPLSQDYTKLKALFLKKVHPLLPILPVGSLQDTSTEASQIVLRQVISLAAAADPDCLPYLRLQNQSTDLLNVSDFSQSLSSAVRAILETSIIPDRLLHIRALLFLSLYTQPTCSEEEDIPVQLGSRAIHHIQTLGLHLLRYEGPNAYDMENLFCAAWALDRINSSIYARPYLLHERDFGGDIDACINKRQPCFRLLLNVIQWLDQVVGLYRPGPSAANSGLKNVAYMDLPVLEGMIVNAEALEVPSHLIATIETFYHAVAILSCRLPRPGSAIAASTLPPSSANARRSLAAERIVGAVPRDCLTSINFIPYAVSLALSVQYRKMRHSRLPMFRARATLAFRQNWELLRRYSDAFWSARVIAELGERVLKEMERAANTLTQEEIPKQDETSQRTLLTRDSRPNGSRATLLPPEIPNTVAPSGVNGVSDYSLIDLVSGQDLFPYLDPNFNLDAVENALEANLDVGLPVNWGDWSQFDT